MSPSPKVRRVCGQEEYRECEQLQRIVWGSISVSSELMSVTQKYGGVVLGVWQGKELAGFLYAFLGQHGRKLIHWSHMMAVHPTYRDQGLGLRMKLAHRRLALERGVRSIGWTFDPLQSRNAALNIHRLGAQVDNYAEDCYGHFPSIIEKGLPSDRFIVHWAIASRQVEKRLKHGPPSEQKPRAACINETLVNSRGRLENRRIHYGLRDSILLLEIPSHTELMREQDLALARRWRLETRRMFQRYFVAGYRVKDFMPPGSISPDRCFYLLAKGGRLDRRRKIE